MDTKQQGFTVIEMLVTVVVAGIFAFMFYQLYVSSVRLNDTARRDAVAGEIAYSNLRKYPTAASVGGAANCALPNATNTFTITTPLGTYPDIEPITQTIVSSWPFACTNPDLVKLESNVSYRGGQKKASYVVYLD